MLALEILFWACLALVAWSYAGYPVLLGVVARLRRRPLAMASVEPTVTIVVSAYNEEKNIGATLERLLALDYPPAKLEIVVVSDCSTDGTGDIVRKFEPLGVRLIEQPVRAGKTAAQNAGVAAARGDVLLFTDATTRFDRAAVRALVTTFADPRVGCVGAELDYVSEGGTAVGKGGGLYWRYEKHVKELEGRVNSLIGVSGCLYGVRRGLYSPIEPDLISDFTIALDIYAKGYVTVYGQGTVSREKTHEDAGREFEMRTRVIVRSIHALVRRARMLDPFRYGLFAVQLWSHKVLRYLVPELVGVALITSLVLALQTAPHAWIYRVAAAGLVLLLGVIPAVYWVSHRLGRPLTVLYAPLYFVHANAAALWALMSYLRGVRSVTWTTVR